MRRDDPSFSRNGAGFTLEGQGMMPRRPAPKPSSRISPSGSLLKRQATRRPGADRVALSKKLQAQRVEGSLAAGIEDNAPAAYQNEVDSYFKALAAREA